jgi:hypothetical protein
MLKRSLSAGWVYLLSLVYLQVSCGRTNPKVSEPSFTVGLSLYDHTRGHEDLTRFAVDLANEKITSSQNLSDYFTRIPVGENGGNSSLPMIKGSFDTDWAVTLVDHTRSGLDLIDFYGVGWIKSGTDWQEMPWLQSLHFLRDQDPLGTYFSREESLDRGRERITKAFEQAIRVSWSRDKAFYWLGHILHTVQDSFSTAHVERTPDFRIIKNICVFGKNKNPEGACIHDNVLTFEGEHQLTGELFHRDRVWKSQPSSCQYDPRDRRWDCLKPEAKKAAEVSAGVLVLYAKIVGNGLSEPGTDGHAEINDFLTKTYDWQGGYFKGSWE